MELIVAQLGRVYIDSIAGIGTTVVIPGLDLTIDLGFLTRPSLRTSHVAITHLHPDHIAGIHGYLGIRSLYGKGPSRFFVPVEVEDVFKRFLMSLDMMQPRPFEWGVTGITDQEARPFKSGFVLKAFLTTHSVPSLGYALIHRRLKLRREYSTLSGPEIAQKKAEGKEELFSLKEDPVLVVTGDTTIHALRDNPLVQKTEYLVVETTFLDQRKDIPAAHLGNHIHLEELLEQIDTWEAEGRLPSRIVLYHISQLYKPEEAVRIVNTRIPERLKGRITLVPPRWP